MYDSYGQVQRPVSPAPVQHPYSLAPVYHYGPNGPAFYGIAPARPSSSAAVIALVMGVVGLLAGWCMFGLPCLAAVVIGHIALNDAKDDVKTGRGMAVAGLVLGYVALIPAIILFFWFVIGSFGAAITPIPSPSAS